MKRLFALVLALVVSSTLADTTGNVLSGTAWTGVTNGTLPTNRMPGSALLYDTATGTVNWSYNQATAAKTIAINNALSGSGVQVGGYSYTYDLRNMNGDDRQGSVDTMTVVTKMTSNTGATLLSNTNTHNTKFDWTTFSGSQSLQSPAALNTLGNLSISFTSKDSGFWSGYFGPEVRNVGMGLTYTVDPCITNPAYSPSCANYNTVNVSNNLVPNPTAYAVSGSTIDQSYAINQALALSGANVMIHGFQWGYQANANGPYCSSWDIFGCWGQIITPSVTTNVSITDNNNNNLYSVSRTYTNSYNTTSYQYLFPSSKNLSTLGRFNFTATTNDAAYIGDMWSKAVYTPDPCTVNPLSSTSCPGYQQAYHDQQCSINPLYASDCPGYTQAFLTMQCSANPLYSPSCPGYAQAYFTQQCSANPLYSADCPGYRQAYHDQQCSINPLYATDCTGYQQAYLNQQCSLNPLYSTQCTGYASAYHDQQCSINPLYASDCTGYQQAYLTQQCNLNPLYSTQCTGYAAAYKTQQCSLNPLYATDCPGYATAYKTQQCTANPLYATDCPGYTAAYKTQQCNLNPLYATDCPGYDVAYKAQQCSINPLYATDCPGYATAYKTQQCSLNALYATDCPGYAAAYKTQQCTANPLYATDCPGYDQAYLNAQCIKDSLYSKLCTGYATAYAIKYLVQTEPGTSAAINSSLSATAAVKANDPTSVNTTGSVSTGNSTVDSVIATPSTTSSTSVTSVTSVIAPPPPPGAPSPTSTAVSGAANPPPAPPPGPAQQAESKKTDNAVASVEKKAGGNRENAKAAATERAKELAKEADKATTMEAQVATQGLVVGLMGYVPGFSAYQNALVPDVLSNAVSRQYMKPNVDNRNAQRRLSGASDLKWQEMVDSQYKIGDR